MSNLTPKPGSISSLFDSTVNQPATARGFEESLQQVEDEVIDTITKLFSYTMLQEPSAEERARVTEKIAAELSSILRKRSLSLGPGQEAVMARELAQRILGLGFLDPLLPPVRTDLSEIAVYSSGLVQIMRKGSVRFETVDVRPTGVDVDRVLRKLLGPQNKRLDESNPTVNAKLPATVHNPGGGRIKAIHPVIAPPGKCAVVNIRLFEQKPVLPAWILERKVMSPEMMADLQKAMEQGLRLLITGGTRTGKTTLLSALCNFLPQGWRIVKLEDPSEIWIDRDTVQTIEARPAALGTELLPYTLANAVDDAMRMSPDYLIVGEVRDGAAAMALFRAMMTGHSGACTFHADSPREAIRRLVTVLGADAQVRSHEAAQMIADSVDVLVQINIRNEKRVVTSIQNISRELKNGDVYYEPVWKLAPDGVSWQKTGELGTARMLGEKENAS